MCLFLPFLLSGVFMSSVPKCMSCSVLLLFNRKLLTGPTSRLLALLLMPSLSSFVLDLSSSVFNRKLFFAFTVLIFIAFVKSSPFSIGFLIKTSVLWEGCILFLSTELLFRTTSVFFLRKLFFL